MKTDSQGRDLWTARPVPVVQEPARPRQIEEDGEDGFRKDKTPGWRVSRGAPIGHTLNQRLGRRKRALNHHGWTLRIWILGPVPHVSVSDLKHLGLRR